MNPDTGRLWVAEEELIQYRFYDSLIVASAVQSGAAILYSEDLQQGRTIGNTRIVNPF